MNLREEYNYICTEYEKRKADLEKLNLDIFTLQPNIERALNELDALITKKTKLEKQLEDQNNG